MKYVGDGLFMVSYNRTVMYSGTLADVALPLSFLLGLDKKGFASPWLRCSPPSQTLEKYVIEVARKCYSNVSGCVASLIKGANEWCVVLQCMDALPTSAPPPPKEKKTMSCIPPFFL